MATITPVTPTIDVTTVTRIASTPAGDVIPYGGGDLLLHFKNGHASAITVSVAPTLTTAKVPGVGPVTVPTRSLSIAAGAEAVMLLASDTASAYVNSSSQIPLTYTGGNALLTVAAFAL